MYKGAEGGCAQHRGDAFGLSDPFAFRDASQYPHASGAEVLQFTYQVDEPWLLAHKCPCGFTQVNTSWSNALTQNAYSHFSTLSHGQTFVHVSEHTHKTQSVRVLSWMC